MSTTMACRGRTHVFIEETWGSTPLCQCGSTKNPAFKKPRREIHARRDWWRFWVSVHDSPSSVHLKALSATLRVGQREMTLGYRRKGWVE